MNGCQDLRPVFGDGNGVLEMGTKAGVGGDDGPAVIESLDLLFTDVDHGLDGDNQAWFQDEIVAIGVNEIWHSGVFVHIESDAVADKVLDDGEAGLFDKGTYDVGHFKPSSMGQAVFHSQLQDVLGSLNEAFGLWADVSNHESSGSVSTIAVQTDAEINAQDIPVKKRLIVGDAVDQDIVATGTDSGWERDLAMWIRHALEERLCSGPAGDFAGQGVELGSGNTRGCLAGQLVEDLDDKLTSASDEG